MHANLKENLIVGADFVVTMLVVPYSIKVFFGKRITLKLECENHFNQEGTMP